MVARFGEEERARVRPPQHRRRTAGRAAGRHRTAISDTRDRGSEWRWMAARDQIRRLSHDRTARPGWNPPAYASPQGLDRAVLGDRRGARGTDPDRDNLRRRGRAPGP